MSEKNQNRINLAEVGKMHVDVDKEDKRYTLMAYLDEYGTISNTPAWTDDEIKWLKELRAQCMPVEIISNLMKRSYAAISFRAAMVKAKSNYLPRWTEKEVDLLIACKRKGLTEKEISLKLGRTVSSISMKWIKLCKKRNMPLICQPWTKEEIEIFKTCKEQKMTYSECSIKLGRTVSALTVKWCNLQKQPV